MQDIIYPGVLFAFVVLGGFGAIKAQSMIMYENKGAHEMSYFWVLVTGFMLITVLHWVIAYVAGVHTLGVQVCTALLSVVIAVPTVLRAAKLQRQLAIAR
jgi:hypothetical protein